ncbi:MAG: DUF1003 domain-containing protein, partial [Actinomycetota bacterium]
AAPPGAAPFWSRIPSSASRCFQHGGRGPIWPSRRLRCPYGLLTMIVSLEAIFLSTFMLISQNRQDDARGHLADQEWRMVQVEEQQNEELIAVSNQILDLTKSRHELTRAHAATSSPTPPAGSGS